MVAMANDNHLTYDQIELWMRDNLLSKQTYNLVNEKSDGRLDRIEAKLDRLTEDRSS